MSGDYSRVRFDPCSDIAAVLMQQGRVQLDSDWNEWVTVMDRRLRAESVDTFGVQPKPGFSGVAVISPQTPEAFRIEAASGNITIGRGRMYVDGLLAENHGGGTLEFDPVLAELRGVTPLPYNQQPYFPAPPALPNGGPHLAYLEVWQREVTHMQQRNLVEKAVGVDTTTRWQTVWQVRLVANIGSADCTTPEGQFPAWQNIIRPCGGRMSIRAEGVPPDQDPCELPPTGGYRGLENQLYRIEIHDGGGVGAATFKWSRDNASVASNVQEIVSHTVSGTELKLSSLGRDAVLRFNTGDWVEILDDRRELSGENGDPLLRRGLMRKITVDDSKQTIKFTPALPADLIPAGGNDTLAERNTRVKRWDQKGTVRDANGNVIVNLDAAGSTGLIPVPAPGEWVVLENGIQVQFSLDPSGSGFRCSDYWVSAARSADTSVETYTTIPPRGIHRHYARLAIVTFPDTETDCRTQWPPAIAAGCCTVTVGENGDFDDIQKAVDSLEGGPGTVCILSGIYVIDKPISIRGFDITILGCGEKSIIMNHKDGSDGAIFKIQSSWDVCITNLWAISTRGTRAIHSVNSNFININDCAIYAQTVNDGTVLFEGHSLSIVLENNLIAGIAGVIFRPSHTETNLHASVRIEQNTVFALQTAILQERGATIIGLDIVDSVLLGFAPYSLFKSYFPESFLKYAEGQSMYDEGTINEAKKAREKAGSESSVSTTYSSEVRFMTFLKAEEEYAKYNWEAVGSEIVYTSSAIIDLQQGAVDVTLQNNTLLGKFGVRAAGLLEASIERNIILVSEIGLSLDYFEGVTIEGNMLYSGDSCIQCKGAISMNLTVSNNRLLKGTHGVQFQVAEGKGFNLIANAQIVQNFMSVSDTGIDVNDEGIWIYDFTAVDNSITGCSDYGIILRGLDENQFLGKDNASFQRVIQRNSIQVKGAGILAAVADSKIFDNDITIRHELAHKQSVSYGIIILADACSVADNTVQGIVDPEKNIRSKGGLLISILPGKKKELANKKSVVRNNRITGGVENGIGIFSSIYDMVIDNNLISDMGLNGIAAAESVMDIKHLIISNNKICRCHQLAGFSNIWWKYAGVVLRRVEGSQIVNNEICENGRNLKDSKIQIGGIYAEQVHGATISNNHIIDNGPPQALQTTSQAVIHIGAGGFLGNEDLKVVGNLIKGSYASALILGETWLCIKTSMGLICHAFDKKSVISDNHFESLIDGPAVELQSNYCIFSNNYIECTDIVGVDAVDLGYGWYVNATGNVCSAPISGAGMFQVITNNVIF